jgi:hypothetical protein
VLESYIYSPVRSFFSFGFQEAEEEKILLEKKKQEDFKK